MKKSIVCLSMAIIMLLSSLVLVSCGNAEPEEGIVTRMTVDINPSVEFMIDDENKVVSVTALNDDGSILIVGESFVGKTSEEAVELMVSIAAETGYLVKGKVEANENTVILTVADLDDNLVEQFFLLSRPYLFIVVFYLTVITGLLRVVPFKRLVKELVIDLLYRLVDIGNVQMCSAAVHVVRREASIIVGKTSFS